MTRTMTWWSTNMTKLKFLFYTAGIGLSYWYYGILQERITRTKHGPDGEMFTCTMSLVLLQCIFNTIFAKIMLIFIFDQGRDRTRKSYYSICSLTYLTAMVSSNMALRHVNYPTQVIGKSCKPIPIMILGVLIGGKRHTLKKYLFILLIVVGVALFMYKKDVSFGNIFQSNLLQYNSSTSLASMLGAGELLLLLSLSMDGLTGAIQERMKAEHATKSGHMMYKMNLWSTFYLLVAVLYTGELFKFYDFINRHQGLIGDIALFSSLSAIGQLFIFLTVAEFGPLPCSVVTTTRKFFTVLTSVFLFGNKLTQTQWLGTSLVFLGLSLDAIYGKEVKHVSHRNKIK
jgi:UDP-galactose transporter B1